jgi:ferritin-like metal-binding protein YciE
VLLCIEDTAGFQRCSDPTSAPSLPVRVYSLNFPTQLLGIGCERLARLEEVFQLLEKKPQAKTCDAIIGITEEGAEIIKEYKGTPALDAGLLAAAQAVEHYEISRYGTLKAWAEKLGMTEAAELLEETLEEEKATDEALTEIAEQAVNAEADEEA